LTDPIAGKLQALTDQQLAAIVDTSDDAILVKDLQGVIHSWNRGAERLFGYRADEVIGKTVYVLIPPDREKEEPYILRLIASGEKLDHFRTVRCRKDGTLVDISLSVTPIRDAEGRVVGATKVARDVSETKRADRQQDHQDRHHVRGQVQHVSYRSARVAGFVRSIRRGDRLAEARLHIRQATADVPPS